MQQCLAASDLHFIGLLLGQLQCGSYLLQELVQSVTVDTYCIILRKENNKQKNNPIASNGAGLWHLHIIHELCSSGSKARDNSLPFLFLCHLVAPETLDVMLVTALLAAGLAFCL